MVEHVAPPASASQVALAPDHETERLSLPAMQDAREEILRNLVEIAAAHAPPVSEVTIAA
jgi:hypothetical protein